MSRFLDRCARLSVLYQKRFMAPNLRACGDVATNPWASLKFFLRGYAFERQGRSRDYAPAAVDAVQEVSDLPLRAVVATPVWDAFSRRLDGQKLNHKNNPLCPQGCRYGEANQHTTVGKSAVEMAADIPGQQPLVAWSCTMLRSGAVRKAHKEIDAINGIGPKIASFFLRDVATHCGIRLSKERESLQPIDTWVQFVARQVSGDKKMTAKACARLIVGQTAEPEQVDQGIWYFCTQVARSSQYLVKQSIGDSSKFVAAAREHLDRLAADGAIAKRLRPTFGGLAE